MAVAPARAIAKPWGQTNPKGGGKGKSFVVETTEAEEEFCIEVLAGETMDILGNAPGKMKKTAAISTVMRMTRSSVQMREFSDFPQVRR